MNILIGADVSPDLDSGAAGTVVETSRALAALGENVETFWADSLGRRIAHGNLHYLLELPRTYRRVARERLARGSFDVVQLSQPHCYLAGRMIRSRPDRPLMIWRSHGLEAKVDEAMARHMPDHSGVLRKTLRRLIADGIWWAQQQAVLWSDGIVVPCQDEKRFLVERFNASPDRVRVIWHGVPDSFIDTAQSTDEGRWRRLLHVSQLSVNKGAKVMHEVAARVLCQRPEATMTWVCPESTHADVRGRLPAEVRSRVDLRGWGSRVELMAMLDSHGIFLFPTLAEGAAKVVMEAMARGMCVVASDTSGPADYIDSGINGVLVPVGDAPAMTTAAIQRIDDPDGSRELGAAAHRSAARFRWSRCAEELVAFYKALDRIRDEQR